MLDKFYAGSCKELEGRIEQHLLKYFPKAFTAKAADWTVYYYLTGLSYPQARRIEAHIKKMKSSSYIKNLKLFPEVMKKLIERYK